MTESKYATSYVPLTYEELDYITSGLSILRGSPYLVDRGFTIVKDGEAIRELRERLRAAMRDANPTEE